MRKQIEEKMRGLILRTLLDMDFWNCILIDVIHIERSELTLFENYSKCRILIFEFWHFPPIFVLLKLTCLVTLFDRKLQVFKNSPKWTIFWHF